MDQNQERQRNHSHRPRRGPDRRGPGRRPPPSQTQDRQGRDAVDVEQIMRDIRSRIAQRQGIDLTNQQIQDLAARRLESILDPRAIKPSLLDGLRRSASAPIGGQERVPNEPPFTFEDTTIYDSHRGALRLARRLLNPLLKLLFNPNPLIRALHLQAKLNVETAERNAERDRRQTEWNSLHFEIVQRLVTEVSRVSLELQALSMRVDALGARVDFNDRRVGNLEGSAPRARPQGRPSDSAAIGPVPESISAPAEPPVLVASDTQTPDASRRRRRRRRGRRGGTGLGEYVPSASQGSAAASASANAAGGVLATGRPPEEANEAPPALELPAAEEGEARAPAPDPLSASIDLAASHPSLLPQEPDGDED